MLARAKAKAEAAEAAARAKAAEVDAQHGLSDKAGAAQAKADAKAKEMDAKHGLSGKAAAAQAKADAKAGELNAKHGLSAKAAVAGSVASAKVAELDAKAKVKSAELDAKAREMDAKHGLSTRAAEQAALAQEKATAGAALAAVRAKEGQAAGMAYGAEMDQKHSLTAKAGAAASIGSAKAVEAKAIALQKSREAAHGQIAMTFYEFDADDSGYLDESEIVAFCLKLGLKLTDAEVGEALAEMEMDDTRDGQIEFAEFLDWWSADSATKAKGSIAFRLQEAKEKAFAAELAAGSPMGQLLAQKQAAAAAAGVAGASASAGLLVAQEKAKKGIKRAQNMTPEEKAQLMSYGSMALSVAMVVCPAGRAAGMASKGIMAASVAKGAGMKMPEMGGGAAAEPTVAMTMQLQATAKAGETMFFKVDGYPGEYKVEVPAGVKKGEMFQFDGDLQSVSEGVPPETDYKAQGAAALAGAGAMLGGTKAGKKFEAAKRQADLAKKGMKMADEAGIKVSPKQAMDGAKFAKKNGLVK